MGHQAPPFVSLQVEPGDLHGHAEHGRSNGDGHLVLEDLEEPLHLLVGVLASTVISSMSRARDCTMVGTVLPRQDAVANALVFERALLWDGAGGLGWEIIASVAGASKLLI